MMAVLKKIYGWWMTFAHVLGTIMGTTILAVLFSTLIGLYHLVFAILGKNNAPNGSWHRKEDRKPTPETLHNLF